MLGHTECRTNKKNVTLLDVLGSEVLRDEEAKILATIAEVCVCVLCAVCCVTDGGSTVARQASE